MNRTLFKGGRVFDGTGAPLAEADVVVEGGRILEVGSGLDGDEAVDASGCAVLPGTFDRGITTVRDAGGADLGVRQAVDDGLVSGPRLRIAVAVLGQTGGHTDGWMPSGQRVNLFTPHPGLPGGIVDGVEE